MHLINPRIPGTEAGEKKWNRLGWGSSRILAGQIRNTPGRPERTFSLKVPAYSLLDVFPGLKRVLIDRTIDFILMCDETALSLPISPSTLPLAPMIRNYLILLCSTLVTLFRRSILLVPDDVFALFDFCCRSQHHNPSYVHCHACHDAPLRSRLLATIFIRACVGRVKYTRLNGDPSWPSLLEARPSHLGSPLNPPVR